MGITLDTGALIAFERADRQVRDLLEHGWAGGSYPTVPTAAIAQAWRDGRSQARLAGLLRRSRIEPLDERLARSAGELMARAGSADAVDAIIALSAATRRDVVLTSDPTDFMTLAAALNGRIKVIGV